MRGVKSKGNTTEVQRERIPESVRRHEDGIEHA